MKKVYKPIDCNLYDEYTLFVMKKSWVKIYLKNEEGEKQEISSVITDVFTKSKAEYLRLATGREIRLDRIESIVEINAIKK